MQLWQDHFTFVQSTSLDLVSQTSLNKLFLWQNHKKWLAQKQYVFWLLSRVLQELNLICIFLQTDVAVESCGITDSKANV